MNLSPNGRGTKGVVRRPKAHICNIYICKRALAGALERLELLLHLLAVLDEEEVLLLEGAEDGEQLRRLLEEHRACTRGQTVGSVLWLW